MCEMKLFERYAGAWNNGCIHRPSVAYPLLMGCVSLAESKRGTFGLTGGNNDAE